MTATLSLTDDDILTALWTVLTGIVDPSVEIVRGQENQVPVPVGPNYIVMTPISRTRLATNIDTWDTTNPVVATMQALAPTQWKCQVDVYGPASPDNAQLIYTLFRDEYAVQAFAATGFAIDALYAGEPMQRAFIDDQKQYENRWGFDVDLQINPVVTFPQQFADRVQVVISPPADAASSH